MSFFKSHPVLYPWPEVLRQTGFRYLYKPREVFFFKNIYLLKLKKGEKVLDVGCGEGILLDRLAKEFKIKGFGLDPEKESIAKAKTTSVSSFSSLNFQIGLAEKLPFKDNFFDAVVSFDALEHVKDQKMALMEMARVIRPGGKILLYTINNRQKWTLNWFLDKLGVDVYRIVDHRPELFLDRIKTVNLLEKRGVKIEKTSYFNAFFTLLADEMMMLAILILSKLNLNKDKFNDFGVFILFLFSGFSKIFFEILNLMDFPWYKNGYANSFLVIGQK